ncbi:MAG: large subunit ribosomal protein [Patescibacteria group bacterium]|nr:large subunit ribosomal protein [Patescibacteria group bacterium]
MTTSITSDIILRPRITEKSGIMGEALNVYTFEVTKNATKDTVAKAIKTLYKVTPTKVRVINLPAKNVFVRGRKGTQSAVKKALVYLKKGDKIDLA